MISRLRLTFRQLGPLDGCWYLLAVLLARASRGRVVLYKYRLMAQPVHPRPLGGGRGRSIDVRSAGPELAEAPHGRPPSVIRHRFAQGAHCLAAWRGGAMAGFLWYCPGPWTEDEVRARYVPATPAAVWDFDVAVFGGHQLGFTFVRLWEEAYRRWHAHGVRWTMSRISAFNPGSRASHGRLGAIKLGSAVFLRCGRWQWTVATLPPFLHLSRREDSMPQFRLAPPPFLSDQP
ncbi:hypothetical protein E4L96_18885 [Massilia arenosa]|uniref:N-acetyltransferase n=1 Tax=Zemynaea arenosa TaxID=2561931 RepID=A0A4Y9S034_9BURK|nr:hypothetical protein [Massilia arenosa]TFW14750.1 hypothetical protein E4L96_18885 [Massilia arenosa]